MIGALINDGLIRGVWLAMVTLIATGSATYTVLQLHAVDALTAEHLRLHAEVDDLKKQLTATQDKLAERLTSLEQLTLVTQQKR